MITFAEVAIGSGGICGCSRCGGPAGMARSVGRIITDLEQSGSDWSAGPGPNVVFTGFEPFAHPELPAIVEAAVSRGFERVRLRTDGGALSRPGNAAGVLGAGVHQLEVVILGGPDTHDALSGRAGLFQSASAGAAAFLSEATRLGKRVAVSGHVPICRHNIAETPAAVAALASFGATAVHIDASAYDDARSEAPQLIAAALETATVNRLAAYVTGWDGRIDPVFTRAPWEYVGMAS